jgi:GNAT superfamily N-acetyltransferase
MTWLRRPSPAPVSLDWMYPCHWDQVIAIGAGRLTEIELRAWHGDAAITKRIVQHANRVVGYAIYRRREHSFSLVDFAVRADRRRQGIGRGMAGRIAENAAATDRRAVHALVPAPDFDAPGLVAAAKFWSALGFRNWEIAGGLRGGPDVWRFTREIGEQS